MGFDYFNSGYAVSVDGTMHVNCTENTNAWVTEIIPLGLEYSAFLSGNGTVEEDTNFNFSADSFKKSAAVLSKIKISSLTANGTLKLNGADCSVDQEIESVDYVNMQYIPNAGFSGKDTFSWQVS